jgi:hypothetical protein
MLKRFLSLMLILLTSVTLASDSVNAKNHQNQEHLATKIKQEVSKLGVDAPVLVKLVDGRKLSGRIGAIDEDSFVFRADPLGDSTVIAYSKVKQIRYAGSSGGANLGPAFLVVGVVFLLTKLIH